MLGTMRDRDAWARRDGGARGYVGRLLAPRALPRTLFAVWLLAGCGALAPKSYVNEERAGALQREIGRQQEQLRQEARALREMADRREREAAILAQDSPVEQRLVERQHELAEHLREAAQEVEARAADLGQQVDGPSP